MQQTVPTWRQKGALLLLALLMLLTFVLLPQPAQADNPEPEGYIVISIETYDRDTDKTTLLLDAPQKVPFYSGDTGADIITRLLGQDNVDLSSGLKSLTIDDITYQSDYTTLISWTMYKNNAEDSVGIADYKPTDGDVYRLLYTTYDTDFQLPIMPNNMDALYWTVAETEKTEVNKDVYEAAITTIQSNSSQKEINNAITTLSTTGIEHRIMLDNRTVIIDKNTVPYTYYPTLSANRAQAAKGETITITVDIPHGMELIKGSLQANGVELSASSTDNEYTFTMPNAHVVITAQFTTTTVDNKILNAVFSLDEAGEQIIGLTPAFNKDITAYSLTIYDYQLPKNTSKLYSNITLADGTSAKWDYVMNYGGVSFPTGSGPDVPSGVTYGHRKSNICSSYTNGQSHQVKVNPEEGTGQIYYFTVTCLPTLSAITINDTSLAGFTANKFDYTVIVEDSTVEVNITSSPFNEDAEISGNGTIVLESGYANTNIIVTDGDNEDIFSTYTITIKTESFLAAEKAARLTELDTLLDTISAKYVEAAGEWQIMDMAAYTRYNPLADNKSSEAAKQQYINDAIATVASDNPSAQTLAKAIIILKSLGYNAADLTTEEGNIVDATRLLRSSASSITSEYDAPWLLIADTQGNLSLTNAQISHLIGIIGKAQLENGLFGYEYEGTQYSDPDTAATILAALGPYAYYEGAQEIIDKVIVGLSATQGDTGSLGSSNTDAMAIIGLAAVGINPDSDSRFIKNGFSLVDGLLSYALDDNSGFGFTDNTNLNELATEQGFRALIAAAEIISDNGSYNIYDFHANDSLPAIATPADKYDIDFCIYDSEHKDVTNKVNIIIKSSDGHTTFDPTSAGTYQLPAGTYRYSIEAYNNHLAATGTFQVSADRTITIELELEGIEVSFRLIGDDKHGSSGHDSYLTWYATRDYLVAEDSTVWDLAVTAFDQAGLSYTWKKGYLSAVESPLTGIKLAEKDNGTASGWMYTVNGKSPSKGMDDYYLEEGDEVIVYFTDDYSTRYTGFSVRDADPSKATLKAALAVLIDEAEDLLDNVAISADGADIAANRYWVDQQAYTALEKALATAEKAYKNAETFDDYQEAISDLAQAIEKFGEKMSYGLLAVTAHFSDVPTTHWAFEYIEYLYSQGLITGKTTTLFAPEAPITRAEVITILARMSGENLAGYNSGFSDVAANAYYAGAVTWGVRTGITNGTTATTFSPNEPITREQIAAMIYRYAEYRGYNFTYTQSAINFTDQSNISAYAFNAVYSMQRAGIIDGYANGAWLPQGYASRAEAAKMLALAQQMFSASTSSYLYAA